MSSIILALFIMAGFTALCFLMFYFIRKRSQRRMGFYLKSFSHLGSRYSLSFASHAILSGCIIGLDGMSRKLLVMYDSETGQFNHCLVDLNHVRSCSIRYSYEIVHPGGAYELYEEKQLAGILLIFEFFTGQDDVEISFYDRAFEETGLLEEREHMARDWEAILSKMLYKHNGKGAGVIRQDLVREFNRSGKMAIR